MRKRTEPSTKAKSMNAMQCMVCWLLAGLMVVLFPVHWQQHRTHEQTDNVFIDVVAAHSDVVCSPTHEPHAPSEPDSVPRHQHPCAFCLIMAGTWTPPLTVPSCLCFLRYTLIDPVGDIQFHRSPISGTVNPRGPPLG